PRQPPAGVHRRALRPGDLLGRPGGGCAVVSLKSLMRARPLDFLDQPMAQGWGPGRLMIRRYEPGEEALLDLRDDFAHAWDAAGHELPTGLRWTLTDGFGRPLAIGGLEPLEPGRFAA